MTTKQAADIIRMLLGCLKGEIEPPKPETIEEAKAFEQQGYECLEMAIKSLEAYEEIMSHAEAEDEHSELIEVLQEIRKAVWDVDIPSPTVPEYIEHHKQIQGILALIDSKIKEVSE